MNYAKIKPLDVSNGPGVRSSIFFSGCLFNCKECFNKEAQDFNYGNEFTKEVQDEFIENAKKDKIKGINILGGEPLQQDLDILENFLYRLKTEVNKPIWLWTGHEMEAILTVNGKVARLLKYVDVVIDGRFEIENKDYMLMYRGSSNQRVIDMKKTLIKNEIVLLDF